MRCARCHAANDPTRSFCRQCGTRLTDTAPNRCTCGFVNRATDQFCGGCGRALSDAAGTAEGQGSWSATAADRRQITVLFCDLVGSTALSEQLDPEDMRELLRSYREAVATIVRRYEGNIARFVGDGILIYFGYPVAHEDDAARAVLAALEVPPAVRALKVTWTTEPNFELNVRLGIHTGLVVAGDIVTGSTVEGMAVVGETPNIASRVQNYAEPGAVLITGQTYRLIERQFVVDDLGAHAMRGVSAPIRIFRVRGVSGLVDRLETAAHLTPFVNREAELGALLTNWHDATLAAGRIVHVVGEAGIGKSRLLQVFHERIEGQPYSLLRCQCSPYAQQSALQPVISGLQRAAGFLPDDPPDERLDKLERFLSVGNGAGIDAAPLFASLLGISFDGRYPPLTVAGERQRSLTLDALIAHVRALARREPLLLIVEDAHWLDPSTLQALQHIALAVPTERILLLIASRPGFELPLANDVPVARIVLERLGRSRSLQLIDQVTRGKRLPARLHAQIVAKTEGVPLFVEELTKTILESGLVVEQDDHWELTGPSPLLSIPATLQDSLLARLDRLSSVKMVAQVAAAIGRDFAYDLLAEITALAHSGLQLALDQLEAAGLIYRLTGGTATYSFKHALVRDAAYESLLKLDRQTLHGRIARALQRRFPEVVGQQPELLAYHLTEAGQGIEAVDFWRQAGRRASLLSACVEASNHFSRALQILQALPPTPEIEADMLAILIERGPPLIFAYGAGTQEVQDNYTTALDLCARVPESPDHFAAFWGWWRVSGDYFAREQRVDSLLALAVRLDDRDLLMQAHHAQWATRFCLGDVQASCEHIQAGLDLYDDERHRTHALIYAGHDAKVCGLGELALVLWLLGKGEEAMRYPDQALSWAREIGHPGSLAHGLDYALNLHRYASDTEAVLRYADELIVLADEQHFQDHRAKGDFFKGWAVARQGDVAAGLALMRPGLAELRRIGTKEDFPNYADMMAEILHLAGHVEEGLTELAGAMNQLERLGVRIWMPELQRRYGLLLKSLDRARADEALDWYNQAFALADRQGAHALALRAAISHAELAGELGRPIESGGPALDAVLTRFEIGSVGPDLDHARRLLAARPG
ncbi:adenylate/guanylate cyclase domain-containing protein [Marinivivus vitaminiproducens]|uniref:adenylate/guanylate cyclase domain-containing protein n=1 Tax=Marinivivus vitaminiproducens TaxID=3035935 RepID=UPI0027A1F5A8|nr:adenylate/guanylate cyclase domain-containing protein [Geminicoccaceae bacterium SCSIO 64248]